MKKITIALLLTFCFNGFSQNEKKESQTFKQNEVKINALYLVFGAFESTYERSLNESSAIGTSIGFSIDNQNDIKNAIAFTPHYRFYFGKKPVSGLFMEGFAVYEKLKDKNEHYYYSPESGETNLYKEKVTIYGLGIGLGGKWYTSKNIVFEINGGFGRNVSIESNVQYFRNYTRYNARIGISAGYRF
ncbi:DUF3575 domain-containing protein [Flavobacterium sp. SUN052]|uniref:DUF3575 domain-containing protein n=1 Tax=Flavobacterium sp. SUN052 TaxID=3002441 RepID=UPI00237EB055|nr:DUF3575 domain-containing protein [Flavobacterium sp. SUN052]MEC4004216.1 DUF3575 domain-containing protein [Flavobacterium sp. SUN052]